MRICRINVNGAIQELQAQAGIRDIRECTGIYRIGPSWHAWPLGCCGAAWSGIHMEARGDIRELIFGDTQIYTHRYGDIWGYTGSSAYKGIYRDIQGSARYTEIQG